MKDIHHEDTETRSKEQKSKFRAITMSFLRSALMGTLLASVVGVLAFVLAPYFDAVGLYVTPARILGHVLGSLIPSTVVYWLVPDGGGLAGVLLIMIYALIFWTIVFGVAHFAWHWLRRRREHS